MAVTSGYIYIYNMSTDVSNNCYRRHAYYLLNLEGLLYPLKLWLHVRAAISAKYVLATWNILP